tara:strand:+ start:1007 stop:1885 length:879 start_codon:yes stop_codon:yes gene_type:complete
MKPLQDSFSHRGPEPEKSILYLVCTPIGNINDISDRAKKILSNVSLIACEDTRTTGRLLKYLKISNKLISLNDHNSKERVPFIISELNKGKAIALVSDAGMPLISDPGELLVDKVIEANFEVITIPGPCAAITALACSGLGGSRFIFYGFLPKSGKERNELIMSINNSRFTSIIYESPKRVCKLLLELKNLCGEKRMISISRELTKKFEKSIKCNMREAIDYFSITKPIGEFTLVISPNEGKEDEKDANDKELKKELLELISAGLSHSSAAQYLAKKHKKYKNEIYNLLLKK